MDELQSKDTQVPEMNELEQQALQETPLEQTDDPVLEQKPSGVADTKVKTEWTLTKLKSVQELGDTIITPVVDKLKTSLKEEEDPDMRKRRNRQRKKQEVAAKRIASTIVVIFLLALAITGYVGYSYVKSSLGPIDSNAAKVIQVEIPEGSSTKESEIS